ncbi:MAG: STAS domain-containing protein [Thermoanaerobaculia bacterium]
MELREIARADGIVQLALIGKLDVAGLDAVQARFRDLTTTTPRNTIVDLSELEFIGSMGIGMLISCAKAMARQDARMVLAGPQPEVGSVLHMTGIDNVIPIVASVEDAEALLAR